MAVNSGQYSPREKCDLRQQKRTLGKPWSESNIHSSEQLIQDKSLHFMTDENMKSKRFNDILSWRLTLAMMKGKKKASMMIK